ncbi:O-antigen polymerase [Cupriavidus consociatus]|uniref:O-antigen polymerase n=1 Tax=Cupriavidus consociatus TaxID=2821357 RepID=UPI001AE8F653|nr:MULTISPECIES: O-antigen polymerase [unclassified Cupriavidus]MBP0624936.1 oligosaccharide repeat unit polymerase [Cupriavidus sp. LEh25]MDK2661668.1 O-antigen polymerase [Cupriavidus sp. LEh21]
MNMRRYSGSPANGGKAMWATLAIGACMCSIAVVIANGRAHPLTVILALVLVVAVMMIRPRNATVRWFRLFLLFSLGIFPLGQLITGDEIYLRLLSQDSLAVGTWFLASIAGVLVTKVYLDLKSKDLRPWPDVSDRTARANRIAYLFAAMSLAALAFMYIKLGGYGAVASAYEDRLEGTGTDYDPFKGLGVIQAFANTSPLWVFVCLMVRKRSSTILTLLAFAQLFGLGWLASGVAGSRQGIVFVLVFALFIYHGFVKPISARKAKIVGAVVALTGIVLIPLKLGLGFEDLGKINQRFEEKRVLQVSMGPISSFLFRDLSRFDVQTTAIEEIGKPGYELSMGRSFLGAIASVIPSALWKGKPDTFAQEKTEIVQDVERGTLKKTTLLFGMPGEFLVNFGLLGYIVSFVIPGWLLVVLNRVSGKSSRWKALRAVLWPLPFLFFLFDSNVMVYYVIRWVLLFGIPMGYALSWPRLRYTSPWLAENRGPLAPTAT